MKIIILTALLIVVCLAGGAWAAVMPDKETVWQRLTESGIYKFDDRQNPEFNYTFEKAFADVLALFGPEGKNPRYEDVAKYLQQNQGNLPLRELALNIIVALGKQGEPPTTCTRE